MRDLLAAISEHPVAFVGICLFVLCVLDEVKTMVVAALRRKP